MKHHAPVTARWLALALFLASFLPALAADPAVGDTVAAKWKDGNYYVGTVTALSGDKASIHYDDGDKLDVPLADVKLLTSDVTFEVGDHVVAAWKGARMYPGTITAVSDLTCTVKWDDGDKPMDVKKGRMFHASEAKAH